MQQVSIELSGPWCSVLGTGSKKQQRSGLQDSSFAREIDMYLCYLQ